MSDDLISRKAAYKAFSDYLNRNFIGEVSSQTELSIGEIASVIKSIPAAFDKKKVIEKLKRLEVNAFGYYNQCDDELDAKYCYIHCYGCDMDFMPASDIAKDVMEAWNRRAGEQNERD